jgi:FG-GAP-like repeat
VRVGIAIGNTYTSTYNLTNPATQNPVTVTTSGVIDVDSASAFTTGVSTTGNFPWSLTNLGIVESVGSYGVGINLASGGMLVNGAAGTSEGYIDSSAIGVQIGGSPGNLALVSNYGTIKTASPNLFGNAIVVNNIPGTIINSGVIIAINTAAAAANGIQLTEGGTVVNAGVIEAYSAGSNQNAIIAFAGSTTIENGNTIETIGSAGTGINIVAGTVLNDGIVSAASQAVALGSGLISNADLISQFGGPGSQAVALGNGSGSTTLLNSGTVSSQASAGNDVLVGSGGGAIVNATTGVITAYHTGIGFFPPSGIASGVLTIVNYGHIQSTQSGEAAGSAFTINTSGASTTVIDNFGTISSAEANGGGAIVLAGGDIFNSTSGLIFAAGGNAVSNGGGPLVVTNLGTIIGSGTGFGVLLPAGSTLVNGGIVAGGYGTAVSFSTGAGNLMVLDPGASFGGSVYGGGGALELAAGSGTLSGLNGSVTGFGSVTFEANAAWQVTIDHPAAFASTLYGLTPDDSLDLAGVAFDVNGSAGVQSGNVLKVSENGTNYTLALDPGHDYANASFQLSSDNAGGTLVTETVRQPAPEDFTGNGLSDILWRNADGDVAIWQMNGFNVTANAVVGSADSTWQIAGTGDFSGDGSADILWQNASGAVDVWEMSGGTVAATAQIGVADSTWHVAGTGDFNGDGDSDILWLNNDGAVDIWEMNGTNVIADAQIGIADSTWHIMGTGDFNGDGDSDILWQNNDGAVDIWEMNGTNVAADVQVGFADPSWHIMGTGDFNGDGMSDILWQNNNGAVDLWEMNGSTVVANAQLGFADPSWHIAGIGDYNGDGKSDILWQNQSGAVDVWEVNGTNVIATGQAGFADPTWSIVPPAHTTM